MLCIPTYMYMYKIHVVQTTSTFIIHSILIHEFLWDAEFPYYTSHIVQLHAHCYIDTLRDGKKDHDPLHFWHGRVVPN